LVLLVEEYIKLPANFIGVFMNSYCDVNYAYFEILKNIQNQGKIKGKRKEIYFMTFSLTNIDKNVLFFPFAQRNWPWILRECSDRMFGIKNPGIAARYSKNWENRKEEGGLFSYHYSDRLNGQMEKAFLKKIHSRDKIISVWDKSDSDIDGRQPCTIVLQPFMEDDNKMSMLCIFRNNDAINILPSDIFIHSTYLKYWCAKSNIEYKNIYWVSAIAYYQKKRDEMKFVDRLLDKWKDSYQSLNVERTRWNQDTIKDLQVKEEIEEIAREGLVNMGALKDHLSHIVSSYVSEWTKIMVMAEAKIVKDKNTFDYLVNDPWYTEFGKIKDSIIYTK
jgi:thymidylate synthase